MRQRQRPARQDESRLQQLRRRMPYRVPSRTDRLATGRARLQLASPAGPLGSPSCFADADANVHPRTADRSSGLPVLHRTRATRLPVERSPDDRSLAGAHPVRANEKRTDEERGLVAIGKSPHTHTRRLSCRVMSVQTLWLERLREIGPSEPGVGAGCPFTRTCNPLGCSPAVVVAEKWTRLWLHHSTRRVVRLVVLFIPAKRLFGGTRGF